MTYGIKKVFATPLDTVDTTDKEGVGTIRFEGNKVYKYIQYEAGAGAVAGVAGNVTYYYAAGGASAGAHASNIVTSDLSDSNEVGAGVLQAALADGEYGWIQIKGPAIITPALTAGADGDPLTATGATDGTLDVAALITDPIVAWADDASAKKIICDFPF